MFAGAAIASAGQAGTGRAALPAGSRRVTAPRRGTAYARCRRACISGGFEEADRLMAEALAVSPDDAAALNNRGTTLRALGRRDEALASYDKALAIRPDFAEALHNRGNVLRDLGRLDEALASYDAALAQPARLRADALQSRQSAARLWGAWRRRSRATTRRWPFSPIITRSCTIAAMRCRRFGRFEEALASYDVRWRSGPIMSRH